MGVAVAMLVGACGDGDEPDDTADEASFCRLALRHEPVAEADVAVLTNLRDLAPDPVDDAVAVLLDLAEQLAELDPGDVGGLELEFETRFGEEHAAARRQVDAFVAKECAERSTTTSPASTSSTSAGGAATSTTSDGSTTSTSRVGQDGGGG